MLNAERAEMVGAAVRPLRRHVHECSRRRSARRHARIGRNQQTVHAECARRRAGDADLSAEQQGWTRSICRSNFERRSLGKIDSECKRPRLWIAITAGDLDCCLTVCRDRKINRTLQRGVSRRAGRVRKREDRRLILYREAGSACILSAAHIGVEAVVIRHLHLRNSASRGGPHGEAPQFRIDSRTIRTARARPVHPRPVGSGQNRHLYLVWVENLIVEIDSQAVAFSVVRRSYSLLHISAQDAATQSVGNIHRLGGSGDLPALRDRAMKQRHIHSQRVEAEAKRIGGSHRGRRLCDAVGIQRPQEDADVLNVVAAATRGDAPHIDFVRGAVESRVNEETGLPTAQLRRVVVPQANVIHILRIAKDPEELDCVCSPSRSIARQLLHHQDGALAAAEGDGIGDLGARIVDRRSDSLHRPVADQIADVRDHPRRACLDELVVVKLIQILCDNAELFLNHHQQRSERSARCLRGEFIQLCLLVGGKRRR